MANKTYTTLINIASEIKKKNYEIRNNFKFSILVGQSLTIFCNPKRRWYSL